AIPPLSLHDALPIFGGFVTLDQGQGDLTISPAGIKGTLSAHVGVNNVPRFALTAAVAIQLDTTGTTPFVRVAATGVTLTVVGQTLSGDFTFQQSGAVTTVTVANGALSLAGISLTHGTGNVTLTAAGVAGTISG